MKIKLKQDLEIGTRTVLKGTIIEVTKDYAQQLIKSGVGREENSMEIMIKSLKKKVNGNNRSS